MQHNTDSLISQFIKDITELQICTMCRALNLKEYLIVISQTSDSYIIDQLLQIPILLRQ
jgi:hypothetical protein